MRTEEPRDALQNPFAQRNGMPGNRVEDEAVSLAKPGWVLACEDSRRLGEDMEALAERLVSSEGTSRPVDIAEPAFRDPKRARAPRSRRQSHTVSAKTRPGRALWQCKFSFSLPPSPPRRHGHVLLQLPRGCERDPSRRVASVPQRQGRRQQRQARRRRTEVHRGAPPPPDHIDRHFPRARAPTFFTRVGRSAPILDCLLTPTPHPSSSHPFPPGAQRLRPVLERGQGDHVHPGRQRAAHGDQAQRDGHQLGARLRAS